MRIFMANTNWWRQKPALAIRIRFMRFFFSLLSLLLLSLLLKKCILYKSIPFNNVFTLHFVCIHYSHMANRKVLKKLWEILTLYSQPFLQSNQFWKYSDLVLRWVKHDQRTMVSVQCIQVEARVEWRSSSCVRHEFIELKTIVWL